MHIEVYSDGSATTKDLPGGYGYVICIDGVKTLEGSGHLDKATNNVAEITAAIRGLEHARTLTQGVAGGDTVTLISDSQLVLRFATGEYQCRKWHLVPLYVALRKIYGELGANTRWVKGHSGDQYNELCDRLANAAREQTPEIGTSTAP